MKIRLLFISMLLIPLGVSAQIRITEADKARAKELVSKMTLEEKISMIAGAKSFYTYSIPRLGIPQIKMADGPQGIRNNTTSTLYPSGIMTAATWNRTLVRSLGNSLGDDARARGVHILLGPGVNIYRSPLCGRNFEYFGEDPYLSSEVAVQYILGVQEKGVMATIKHFVANNQEYNRHNVSSDVDERTLQEIYFPSFRKAVQVAGVGSVMDSYNLLNSVHATENAWLNIDILRKKWGFEGLLMSDWTSVYSTYGAIVGGLDLECPVGRYFNHKSIMPLIANGVVSESDIDLKVQHILQTFIAFGFLDKSIEDKSIPLNNPESAQTALKIAEEGTVLLKNEDKTLPLSKKKSKILVLGPNADKIPSGGGSGSVHPFYAVSVYQGLSKEYKNVSLLSESMLYKDITASVYADENMSRKGFKAEYFNTRNPEGEPVHTVIEDSVSHSWGYGSPFPGMPADQFSVRWTGYFTASKTASIRFLMGGDDGYRVSIDDKRLGGDWGNHSMTHRTVFFNAEKGRKYKLTFEFFDNAGEAKVDFAAGIFDAELFASSVRTADKIIYCAGFDNDVEGEGFDRPFKLPASQTDIINSLDSSKLILLVNAGGGVDLKDLSRKAKAVLMTWYPGQEGGTAISNILSGKVSPSGKLPISIEEKWEDNPVFNSYYDVKSSRRVTYSEGVFVGYRGYDRLGVKPLYPFGYGLSYTDFEYSDLKVEKAADGKVKVSFNVRNTGKVDAAEVAQVYVHDVVASVPRPYKELKGYDKKFIKKGEKVRFEIELKPEDFSFYDIKSADFLLEKGEFNILVGPSSDNLPLVGNITL